MRYYLLAERETANLRLSEPASAPRLAGAMPPGALARGPWARERRIALEAAHAQARQSPRREDKEAIFADARRAFVRALRTEAWKLLPLPKDDPEALLVVFDTDGSVGTLATQSVRCVGEFLETPTPEELSEILLSAATLSRPFAPGLSYVHAKDLRTFCFTGHYGKVLHKSSGSLLLTSEDGVGQAYLFEILNFLGFPRSYSLPPEMALRHRYKVVGNSIAVTVASELLRLLLLGQGAADLAQMEQPPPTRRANSRQREDILPRPGTSPAAEKAAVASSSRMQKLSSRSNTSSTSAGTGSSLGSSPTVSSPSSDWLGLGSLFRGAECSLSPRQAYPKAQPAPQSLRKARGFKDEDRAA
eukprot:s446_g6.t1